MYKYKNKLTVKKGMKRYVARRSRIIRDNIDVDGGMIKCEAYDQITINSGATSPIFFQSTNTFVNLLTLIQSSSSFQENIPIFGRYKIVGMNIRASLGAAIASLDAAFPKCAPTLILAFYPQLAGTALGVNPAYNDQKLLLDPSLAVPQTKYWKFHDNYFDNGASGFGVWTSTTSGSGVQTGQLPCTLNIPEAASATVALFNVGQRFISYLQHVINDGDRIIVTGKQIGIAHV